MLWTLPVILVVAACTSPGPTATPTVTTTLEPAATERSQAATPTPIPSPEPTLPQATTTPAVPTSTTEPTATPEPLRPLTVDVNAAEELGPFDTSRFLNGSVGGYAPLANYNWLPDAYDELTAIDMEMVRLDHITDDAFYRVVWRSGSGLEFDFSRLNRVAVPLLEAGMTPLLCLSYKPDVLAPEGSSSLPPADMGEWAEVVRGFVEHFQRMGYTGLHWEVWNEPDQAFFFQGGPQEYINLYVTTAQAIKEVDPSARVGGAADSSVSSPHGKLRPLLAHISEHPGVPLDFVSYHDYSDPDGDGLPPFDLGWNVATVETMIAEAGLAPRDIFVTEWNLTPSLTTGPGAPTDTHQGAAAAAVELFNLLDYPGVKRLFYFSPIEGYKPEEIFSGDLGLLTVNYHRKAMYNLFEMISKLGDRRLGARIAGENSEEQAGYAMATLDTESGATAVLAWNYWDQARTMDLSVSALPYADQDRNVRVTRYLIDADHGNYYRDYSAGLRGYDVGPTEALVPVEDDILLPTDAFSRRVTLAPHSVTLLILEPTDLEPAMAVDSEPALGSHNYAAGKPVEAASDLNIEGWERERLVDEITHSLPNTFGWSSDLYGSPDQEVWVEVDLGQPVVVGAIRMHPRDDYGYEGAGFPMDLLIQGAVEREQWIDILGTTGYNPGEFAHHVQSFEFTPGTYRYIRVSATRLGAVGDDGYAFQLAELEVIASSEVEQDNDD